MENLFGIKRLIAGLAPATQAASPGIVQGKSDISPEGLQQIAALLEEKANRTPAQRKIASALLQAVRESRGQQMAVGARLDPSNIKTDSTGMVLVDITATVSDRLLMDIQQLGGEIIFSSAEYNAIRAQVQLSSVEAIATSPDVTFIRTGVPATTNRALNPDGDNTVNSAGKTGADISPSQIARAKRRQLSFKERAANVRAQLTKFLAARTTAAVPFVGKVTSQGDKAHQADTAKTQYGFAGEGIRIGVMSDSFNYLGGEAADIAGGDLPGPGNPFGNLTRVTIVQDLPNPNPIIAGSDEGRAMMQIVHDLAPKAQLFFASAFISEAGFATNIKRLRDAPNNCDIVIDDVFYSDEPPFQDGIVAQAVNYVTNSGGLYFSSAGNQGSVQRNTASAWEGDFNDAGSTYIIPGNTKSGTVHNFGTVAAPVNGNILLSASGFVYALEWSDPLGASTNDYDLFVVNAAGTTVKAASTNIQNGTIDPHEEIGASAFTRQTGDRLVIFKSSGAAVRALHLNAYSGRLTVFTSGQTHGHSAAAGAFSVAAAGATAANTSNGLFTTASRVETFSSDGPRRVFYNPNGTPITPGNLLFGTSGGTVRQKPDITAADNVTTSGNNLGGGLTQFSGTSAAAPHAGAIAALIKSANPGLTPAQIRTILTASANTLDIETAGVDVTTGFGILNANAIVAAAMAQQADLAVGTTTATEGSPSNSNTVIEPGEYANVVVQLINPSLTAASNVNATLTSQTPGVTIVQGSASYGTINAGANASNTATPFVIGISPSFPCGSPITLAVTATLSNGSPVTSTFSVNIGGAFTPFVPAISGTLSLTPPTGAGFISVGGTKVGTLARNAVQSTCASPKSAPLSGTGFSATTGGRYAAFTFANPSAKSQCVSVTVTSSAANNLQTAAFDNNGFVPATSLNAGTNYLADPGTRAATMTYSFVVPGSQSFTVVIYDATTGGTAGATNYTLTVSYSTCAAAPACTPVTITNGTIASGSTGTPYSQSFSATGGSGNYAFSLSGNLPAGLSFSGNTLSGTPTQAGSFPITITATDPTCPAGTKSFTLVIAGTAPASVTATAGSGQSVIPGTAFPVALQATVRDGGSNPLGGVNVTFSAPTSGASGTFAGGVSSVTVVTNGSGVATAPTFTANTTTGSYAVTANVNGVAPASFNLNNTCPATITVTSNADSGAGTLRETINNACPGITVNFAVTGTITLTSGELAVNKAITINGPGAGVLAVSANQQSRVFNLGAGTGNTVSISGLTIRDGLTKADGTDFFGGGGVLIRNGTVNLTDCWITANSSTNSGNPNGGGVDNEGGTVTITRCAITNNTITNNIASNGAFYLGGGVFHEGTAMTIDNSTIAGNVCGPYGAGGGITFFTNMTLTNSTVFGNSANLGGNIARGGGTLTFKNNIIAGGILVGTGGAGVDINGTGFSSQNFNLIQTTAGGTITGTTTNNITGVSPNLLPLGNYGGPTPSLLTLPNSPVINVGDPAATGVDQRGLPRVVGGSPDIGAVEANYLLAATGGTPQSTVINTAFSAPLQATVTESGNPVNGVTVTFTAPPVSGPTALFGGLTTTTAVTNASGIALSPTPTANGTTGNYGVAASIGTAWTNANYNLTNLFSLGCPLVTLSALSNPSVGVAYNGATAASPAGAYTYSITQGSLPAGFVLNPTTGAITGAVSMPGTYSFTLKATDASGCSGARIYSLAVACPTITLSALPTPVFNTPYSQTVAASPAGGSYTYSVTSGALPLGLSLNSATGAITGTPTTAGAYSFTVTATGFGSCTGSQLYTGTVASVCGTVTLASLPNGSVGQLYSNTVTATPAGTYNYSVTTGALPPGLSLYSSFGLVFGYPTAQGTYTFTITATSSNCTGNRSYSVTIGAGSASALTAFSDFDGDGKSDLSVWRGTDSNWLIARSGDGKLESTPWGASAAPYFDVTASGDYDGDGRTDLAVFRRGGSQAGTWYIKRSSDGQTVSKLWGLGTDVPVAGDYDGDGRTDMAVWRGSEGKWYISRSSDGAVDAIAWGAASVGDVPVPGDYDGDGKTDPAVFRRTTGYWYVKNSSNGQTASKLWGQGTDVPVPGDYDGDGKTDIAVWRGSDTNWYIVQSSDSTVKAVSWGTNSLGDVPVPGDYDGDGKADVAVWRESGGMWYAKLSGDGTVLSKAHGQSGDTPVMARHN